MGFVSSYGFSHVYKNIKKYVVYLLLDMNLIRCLNIGAFHNCVVVNAK